MASLDRYCGMAPNMLEHSLLLQDLALGIGPTVADDGNNEDGLTTAIDDLFVHFASIIIDSLSNVPGGGMTPIFAQTAVVLAVSAILKYQKSKQMKRNLHDNID